MVPLGILPPSDYPAQYDCGVVLISGLRVNQALCIVGNYHLQVEIRLARPEGLELLPFIITENVKSQRPAPFVRKIDRRCRIRDEMSVNDA